MSLISDVVASLNEALESLEDAHLLMSVRPPGQPSLADDHSAVSQVDDELVRVSAILAKQLAALERLPHGRRASSLQRASVRLALRHLTSARKPEFLRAIDFVLGLIREFEARDLKVSLEVPNRDLLRRLIRMRQMVQDGFDLSLLVENDEILSGKGDKIVKRIKDLQKREDELRIRGDELASFMKTYPNRSGGARKRQGDFFRDMIARDTGVSPSSIDELVMQDNGKGGPGDFFVRAFEVVNKYVKPRATKALNKIVGGPGKVRAKEMVSTWRKQGLKKYPFYLLGDLLGCMAIVDNTRELATACETVQSSGLDIVEKDNKYLDSMGHYNAVHYAVVFENIVVEYQLKSKASSYEAALSHDLVKLDKFQNRFEQAMESDPTLKPPSAKERALIEKVVDVSTQLGLNELEDYFNIGLEVSGEMGADAYPFLYGDDMSEEELSRRIRMASDARRRVIAEINRRLGQRG